MERAPATPAPMEARVGLGAAGQAGRGAGLVEGHLPKIEADLSFRVLPKGCSVADGDGDSSDGGGLGNDTSLGVGGGVGEGTVGEGGGIGLGSGFGDAGGGEEEEEEEEGSGVDAAENDRWGC